MKKYIDKKVREIIGDDSDLICINCKKERKMRFSAYCPKCKKENEKYNS